MSFKVAFIGAGSIGFTRRLLCDLLAVPEFSGVEIAFTDISADNLSRVTQLCQRDIDAAGLNIKILSTTDRRAAFAGAKYIFCTVRVGGMEAFYPDIEIPLQYGVDQCVGDTLCTGGIFYGQRGIAAMREICKDIREVAMPGCLLLNYANPNAMITWACNEFFGVNTIGLCHGVQGGHSLIAGLFGLQKEEVDIICAGINHQTWYIQVRHNGEDLTGQILEKIEAHPEYSVKEKVRIDMLKRFGYFSTESNGHLSEYVPWYRTDASQINDWISLDSWINGETGGYLRVCTENKNWFVTEFPRWLAEPPQAISQETRGHEHGAYIIESLETGRVYRGHFNVVNNGCITNLPDDAIVEVPGYVDANGVNIPRVGDLPLGCAAVCNASISVQRLAVHAAVNGDDMLLRQSLMMDPLTGAVLNPPQIWQMADDMLIAMEQWLPQYSRAIAEAKKRRETQPRLPTRENYQGAARLHTKTVDEMRAEKDKADAMAKTADKGNL